LYGCESWSFILEEEHRLRVSENRVVRRIFGPNKEEETGGRKKLYKEELRNFTLQIITVGTGCKAVGTWS